nr:DUF6682 family protein [Motiliproteus coralliicola]
MLSHLSAAQLLIATLAPESASKVTEVTLVAGAEQTLPADGRSFVRGLRLPTGAFVRQVEKRILDEAFPNWQAESESAAIKHTMIAPKRKMFYVYPPAVADTKLVVEYLAVPSALNASSALLSIADEYADAAVHYALFLAFTKDSDDPGQLARGEVHKGLFTSSLNGAAGAEVALHEAVENE